ncbi:hypothetical protein RYZ26_19755 [Terasakiella sp. A23]|uniref:hypothetical protein n=1 Tax=Terasakiella sp. FCG-A23 TaxID=3080561 RepID=UPI00295566EF|nr:hypothetical protein [Terasakiella sp. A23]MDV7341841.1 hypothetical protein [Terasakiella sp. A23]
MTNKDSGPKRDKFRELAVRRTDKALEAIERIGNLSNKRLYEWEAAEIKKIVKALKDEVSKMEAKFADTKDKRKQRFTF